MTNENNGHLSFLKTAVFKLTLVPKIARSAMVALGLVSDSEGKVLRPPEKVKPVPITFWRNSTLCVCGFGGLGDTLGITVQSFSWAGARGGHASVYPILI